MDTEAKLLHHLGLTYDVLVRQKAGTYSFFIRELGLRHESSDPVQGLREILEKKDAWIRDLAEEGLWSWIVEPGGQGGVSDAHSAPSALAGIKPFLIKLCLVGVLLFALVVVVSNGLRDLGYNLEKKLDSVVAMQPESVEMHRAKAHAIAEKLRPIALEVLTIFRPEPESKAPQGAPDTQAEPPAQTVPAPAPSGAPARQ